MFFPLQAGERLAIRPWNEGGQKPEKGRALDPSRVSESPSNRARREKTDRKMIQRGRSQQAGGGRCPRRASAPRQAPTHLSPPEPYTLPCIMSVSKCGTISKRWFILDKTESALALPAALGFAFVSELGVSQEFEVAIPYP